MLLKIGLLGNEANYFADCFSAHSVDVLQTHEDITAAYELIFCTSYTKLIPAEYLNYPKYGVFINHSTDLPKGRGWAPIQWSVLHGLDHVTITLFKAVDDKEPDTGPWVYKSQYTIEDFDTLQTLYQKDRLISTQLFQRLISDIECDTLEFHEQVGPPTHHKKRTQNDAELDANKPLIDLWDHIRICDNAAYPAFFKINGHKVFLRYEVVKDN